MLKNLTRKLLTLFVLVAAITAVPPTPASSTNRVLICFEAPLEAGCNPNIMCCDSVGECRCGG